MTRKCQECLDYDKDYYRYGADAEYRLVIDETPYYLCADHLECKYMDNPGCSREVTPL